MKTRSKRWTVAGLAAACVVSSVGCYPVYPPGSYQSAYQQDSKDSLPQEQQPAPGPAGPPVRYGVDPALAIAGVAAAGILGYAIANNHGHHGHYYGPGYYQPTPYYGRGYYRPRYYR